jgi:hypothetical protein
MFKKLSQSVDLQDVSDATKQVFESLSVFIKGLAETTSAREITTKVDTVNEIVVICPDCDKKTTLFRGACGKCANKSWLHAGSAGGFLNRLERKAQIEKEAKEAEADVLQFPKSNVG